ncbi:hypothetical protein [Neisseria dentiae]|uniref:hypothetical protein n=1 Tax=Neisseria dentiae TaxID=194197 RepID=UPI00359FA7C2
MKKLPALLLGLMLAANVYAAGTSATATAAVQNQNDSKSTVNKLRVICFGVCCPQNKYRLIFMPIQFCPNSPAYIGRNR